MDRAPPLSTTTTTTAVVGAVDHRGRRAYHSTSGGWTSALFIIGVEVAERIVYYGVSTNMITYLTGPLGESTAAAAVNVNTWSGASSLLPLPLGFIADSWVGRYRTIVTASLLYILGLGMLTFSAVAPSLQASKCTVCSPSGFRAAFFFFSIYLISFAQGGHKPCVQAFGADQFDENDPGEYKAKSSFFNWWYFGLCFGSGLTVLGLSYVQDNIGWGLGFGIPFAFMVLALLIFLLGTKTYRFYERTNRDPFANLGKGVQGLLRSGQDQSRLPISEESAGVVEDDNLCEAQQPLLAQGKSKFLTGGGGHGQGRMDALLKLFPIWAACLVYAIVFSQSATFFTKQGSTLDRRIGESFQVPPAGLQSFISVSILILVPIYDRVIVPVSRKFSGLPTGITMLQRIGTGMFLSMVAMVTAALVEIKRLKTAENYGLIDSPETPIPMSLWWLVPQYILFGVADVFTMVGLQEFFYDQVPDMFRSLGLALYLSIFGIGALLSSALVSVIDKVSSRDGRSSWFSDNLNRAHLDYFYWLLAALSAAQILVFLYFSRRYIYKKRRSSSSA